MSRKEWIIETLSENLNPIYIEVEDETQHHHTQGVKETHFKILLVSAQFTGIASIERHRMTYQLLNMGQPQQGIHALSLTTQTPEEWAKEKNKPSRTSPPCHGGYKKTIKKGN